MRIFKHTGNGHYIGSCVIVVAKDEDQAKEIIRMELNSIGLEKEVIDISEIKIKKDPIIYSYNGDY